MPTPAAAAPLVAHVVFRFDHGGVENGIVNLVTRVPAYRYRRAIVALEGIDAEFARRVRRPDVELVTIHKRPGKDPVSCRRIRRTPRRLRPAIVHARNLATFNMQLAAVAAGVRCRVHGERGWSPTDPRGLDPRNLRLRRLLRPVPQAYVAMSRDIARWVEQSVGVPPGCIRQLYSGVDCERFRPKVPRPAVPPWRGAEQAPNGASVVLGTVGRLDPIKNQAGLLRAFRAILDRHPAWQPLLRLIIAGEGQLRVELAALAREVGLEDSVGFPGTLSDPKDAGGLCRWPWIANWHRQL